MHNINTENETYSGDELPMDRESFRKRVGDKLSVLKEKIKNEGVSVEQFIQRSKIMEMKRAS